jgi:hypothetical protein
MGRASDVAIVLLGCVVVAASVWIAKANTWISGFPTSERGRQVGVWVIRLLGVAVILIGIVNATTSG